jgi:hypothetical protein
LVKAYTERCGKKTQVVDSLNLSTEYFVKNWKVISVNPLPNDREGAYRANLQSFFLTTEPELEQPREILSESAPLFTKSDESTNGYINCGKILADWREKEPELRQAYHTNLEGIDGLHAQINACEHPVVGETPTMSPSELAAAKFTYGKRTSQIHAFEMKLRVINALRQAVENLGESIGIPKEEPQLSIIVPTSNTKFDDFLLKFVRNVFNARKSSVKSGHQFDWKTAFSVATIPREFFSENGTPRPLTEAEVKIANESKNNSAAAKLCRIRRYYLISWNKLFPGRHVGKPRKANPPLVYERKLDVYDASSVKRFLNSLANELAHRFNVELQIPEIVFERPLDSDAKFLPEIRVPEPGPPILEEKKIAPKAEASKTEVVKKAKAKKGKPSEPSPDEASSSKKVLDQKVPVKIPVLKSEKPSSVVIVDVTEDRLNDLRSALKIKSGEDIPTWATKAFAKNPKLCLRDINLGSLNGKTFSSWISKASSPLETPDLCKEWGKIRASFKGVGLFQRPSTPEEKKFRAQYDSFKRKHPNFKLPTLKKNGPEKPSPALKKKTSPAQKNVPGPMRSSPPVSSTSIPLESVLEVLMKVFSHLK